MGLFAAVLKHNPLVIYTEAKRHCVMAIRKSVNAYFHVESKMLTVIAVNCVLSSPTSILRFV